MSHIKGERERERREGRRGLSDGFRGTLIDPATTKDATMMRDADKTDDERERDLNENVRLCRRWWWGHPARVTIVVGESARRGTRCTVV